MDTTFSVSLGDRGRLVVPAPLREGQHWEQGTPLIMLGTERGVLMMTREQAKQLVRDQLTGASLVEELVADRRRAAAAEEVA